jgi:hypothetical protein
MQTPEKGSGINVRCEITFYRFGEASKKLKNLRESSFSGFKANVMKWAHSLNMEVISIQESGEVKVIMDEI